MIGDIADRDQPVLVCPPAQQMRLLVLSWLSHAQHADTPLPWPTWRRCVRQSDVTNSHVTSDAICKGRPEATVDKVSIAPTARSHCAVPWPASEP